MSGQLIGDLLSVGGKVQQERDRLAVELQESERLRTEAFQACETMRQELQAITLERDEWKAGAEYQQQQATQLRLQVAALEASVDQEQGRANRLQRWAADLQAQLDAAKNEASKTGWVVVGSHLPNREQLDAEIVRLTNNWAREIDERKALQQQVSELQAQLEAAAVTPAICPQPSEQIPGLPDGSWTDYGRVGGYTPEDLAFHESRTTQQPNYPCSCGAAERMRRVRRMIRHVLGWYACVEYFDEIKWAEAWEQVGALLGHLQREAD